MRLAAIRVVRDIWSASPVPWLSRMNDHRATQANGPGDVRIFVRPQRKGDEVNWFTGVMVYVMVWWVVLFAVLPIGVRPDHDGDAAAGGWRGAPEAPQIGRKLLWTTLAASLIFAGLFAVIQSDWLSFRPGGSLSLTLDEKK